MRVGSFKGWVAWFLCGLTLGVLAVWLYGYVRAPGMVWFYSGRESNPPQELKQTHHFQNCAARNPAHLYLIPVAYRPNWLPL